MAGLWWITVTMAFCLSAGRLAEIDKKRLAGLIQQIKTDIKQKYKINTMYAVALSIPKDPNQVSYDLTKVMPSTQKQQKWNEQQGILTSARLVIATKKDIINKKVKYTEHAEWRVLQNLNLESKEGDLLVFFSHASPCDEKCGNPGGKYRITDQLRDLFDKTTWGGKAFVFEVPFKPHGQNIDSDKIKLALTNIGNYIGLKNIFRCYTPNEGNFHCISYASGNQINKNC